jgi:dynein heavy chain
LAASYETIRKDGEEIQRLVAESRSIFESDGSSDAWSNYLKYIDVMVIQGLQNAVRTSLSYFLDNMDQKYLENNDLTALFECKLELGNTDLVFTPKMEDDAENGFMSIMKNALNDIYKITTLISPVYGTDDNHYKSIISSSQELEECRNKVIEKLQHVVEKCHEYRESFEQFSYLWTENRQEFLKSFVKSLKAGDSEGGSAENDFAAPLHLEQFEQQIRKYEEIHKNVMNLEGEVVFYGWFRVDAMPLKQSLNMVVKKWAYSLTKYLSDATVNSLSDLN